MILTHARLGASFFSYDHNLISFTKYNQFIFVWIDNNIF